MLMLSLNVRPKELLNSPLKFCSASLKWEQHCLLKHLLRVKGGPAWGTASAEHLLRGLLRARAATSELPAGGPVPSAAVAGFLVRCAHRVCTALRQQDRSRSAQDSILRTTAVVKRQGGLRSSLFVMGGLMLTKGRYPQLPSLRSC